MADFLTSPIGILALTVAQTLALLVPVLIAVAYLTWAERKVGDGLHLEVDLMARYAARLAEARAGGY